MKKLLLIALVTFTACGPTREEMLRQKRVIAGDSITHTVGFYDLDLGISVVKIGGCEYVYCETTNGVAIVHKQNCKNH